MKYTLFIFFTFLLFFKANSQQVPKENWKGKYRWEMPGGLQEMKLIDLVKFKDKVDKSKASKSSTLDWIINKLKSYLKEEYTILTDNEFYDMSNPFSSKYDSKEVIVQKKIISVKNDNLSIYIEQTENYNNKGARLTKENILIPLSNLENVEFINYETLVFTTYDKTIMINNYKTDYISLKFETGKETNIRDRFKRAFIHLATFYFKDASNEIF